MEEMAKLEEDQPIAQFLDVAFCRGKICRLRRSVQRFAEGYDLADLATASTIALYKEWSSEEDSGEYRVDGGYGRLVDYLVRECRRLGAHVHFGSAGHRSSLEAGSVEVMTAGGERSRPSGLSSRFRWVCCRGLFLRLRSRRSCELPRAIGYGSVIKILLEFRTPFWREVRPGAQTLFILASSRCRSGGRRSDERSTLLTGWLTGREYAPVPGFGSAGPAGTLSHHPSRLSSPAISRCFGIELAAFRIFDWQEQPFVHGGYSFDMVIDPCLPPAIAKAGGGNALFCGGSHL